MVFGYNLILHASIIPVNIAIITKEVLLEFFQLNQKRIGKNDRLALGISDILNFLESVQL